MSGRALRLKKLFANNENAVVVAIDHGEFDGPLPGMIDLPQTARLIPAQVDGVLLSPGMMRHCSEVFGFRGAPIPIIRLNWSTVYCFHWEYQHAATVPAMTPGQAVAAGAEIVLISLTLQTGSEAGDAENVRVFCELAREAERVGVPIMGECFPANADKLSPDQLHAHVYRSVRILSELGADFVKTFFTSRFEEVTRSCPVPVLGLGAEKTPTEMEALQLAYREINAGARGVVFGRNVTQAKDPARFAAALCDVVKRGVEPAQAARTHGIT